MKDRVSLSYDGGWKQLNSIADAAWAIVFLLLWISLLLGAILMSILGYIL